MKKLLLIALCLISNSDIYGQIKKYFKDIVEYRKAYEYYLDSISEYKNQQKYIEAIRRIEPGLNNDVFNKIDDAISLSIFGEISPNSGLDSKDREKIKAGEIVFVNYTTYDRGVINRWLEVPVYPKIKPVYIAPKTYAKNLVTVKANPIVISEIELKKTTHVDVLMMPDGNRYSVDDFEKRYGKKPLISIFNK